ncbi:MAG: hypothetical protein JEZ04_18200 [Spirochaetales bacterium]|nr:hypothetical protein [Spirochaetales bacterium]
MKKSNKQSLTIILLNITFNNNIPRIHFYFNGKKQDAILGNPEVLSGNLIPGTELTINLFKPRLENEVMSVAELVVNEADFLPDELCDMIASQPPVLSTFFGLISTPVNEMGRYYMLRDHNADGLLFCTGIYYLRKGRARCLGFDGQWAFRYNIVENFFYASTRPKSEIKKWKHPSLRLSEIDEEVSIKNMNRKFRNNASGWHRYNFFFTDDWSLEFYLRQARLGFIAITHSINGKRMLTPQLQREYAVLDWDRLIIDKGVRKILRSGRIKEEGIHLRINSNPDGVLEQLRGAWKKTWITAEYSALIQQLTENLKIKRNKNFRIWGVTLTAGTENKIIAGELGYSIGRTYTSLSGFFHRSDRKYNNFGKLQMVMLAEVLMKAGLAFWNLGQPYMEYKLKLGAEVVPRGLFLKRWDKAARGRTPDLSR